MYFYLVEEFFDCVLNKFSKLYS